MLKNILPAVNWTNGTIMIGIFALVCVGLVVMLLLFLSTGKKKNTEE